MARPGPRLRRLRAAAAVGAVCAALGTLPFSTCLSRLVLRRPCPGCGMTRAALALLRGDVAASLHYNPAALLGAAVAATAVALAAALPEGHPLWGRFTRASLTALALALTAVWALRLAGLLADV